MKLSEDALMTLQFMSRINPHLVVEAGSRLKSLSLLRSRLLQVDVVDVFPVPFALHDLVGFLKQLTLFDNPDFDFGEKSMIITDEFGARLEYWYSMKEDLIYANRELPNFEADHIIEVPESAIDKIIRSADANNVEDISLFSDGENAYIKSLDKDNPKRVFSVCLGPSKGKFTVYFKHSKKSTKSKVNNRLTLMPMGYTVHISSKGLTKFIGKTSTLTATFFLAAERDSEYN